MNTFKLEALISVAARGRFYNPVPLDIIDSLVSDGFIESRAPPMNTFKLTEKGRIMVNALASVPEPVIAYTMPGKE